jgi:hypothetical protein
VVLLEEIVSSVDHSMFHIEEDMDRPPTQDVTDTAASNLV